MVTMNVEIMSREIIKPSSQNPGHLKKTKLSFLDQIALPIYVPMVLFYNVRCNQNFNYLERVCLLKKSLADSLVHFFPLAGTIRDQSFVDCDDKGIKFLQAQVNCTLSQVTKKRDVKTLNKLLPFEPYGGSKCDREPLLSVQFNVFSSVRIAISVCVSHKIADGISATRFVNAWAAIARSSNEFTEIPNFHIASHFPPKDMSGFTRNVGITKDNIVTKRFVFEKSNIDALRVHALSATVKAPTRVETVSAFIWKCFIKTILSKPKIGEAPKICAALHAVDLRDRMVPPMPKHSFRNAWRIVTVPVKVKTGIDYPTLVSKLRSAIRDIDADYVKELQNGDGHMNFVKKAIEQFSSGGIEFCNFTSWCKFPVYEVDFGWGKPDWVCSPSRPYKNVVILMGTKDGDGIEAWVNLLEEDMALFECDPELLSYVSFAIGG